MCTLISTNTVGMSESPRSLKTVVVGDRSAGKTSMIITYHLGEYPTEYLPMVYHVDGPGQSCEVRGEPCILKILDTSTNGEYNELRPRCYPNTDVLILMVGVTDFHNWKRIVTHWVPELKLNCPDVPILLVGSRTDLRGKPGYTAYQKCDGESVAREIGAVRYMEICALKKEGLKELFSEVLRVGDQYHVERTSATRSKNGCTVL